MGQRRWIKLIAWAALSGFLCGCGKSSDTPEHTTAATSSETTSALESAGKTDETTATTESEEAAGAQASPATAIRRVNDADIEQMRNNTSSLPAAAPKPDWSSTAVAAATGAAVVEDYTAEIQDILPGTGNSYTVSVSFSYAEGRHFSLQVVDTTSRKEVARQSFADLPDGAATRNLTFTYQGPLNDLEIRLVEEPSGKLVDSWRPE